ncbi:MAG TPA: alpha/beta hydrolase, partial [Ramlibacter sp.]|nr:alpha/beta hydrolase [Ramlibacter sp.]
RGRNVRAFLYPKPQLATGRREDIRIPGPAGEIPARVIWPVDGEPTATLVYFHGGGFILGDIASHEAHCIRIANRTGAVVVTVDYRLAPEDPFPAGVEDSLAATRWVHASLDRFAGVQRPFALGGDSAGGNMAAVSAIACRDAGIRVAVQFLLYPATDLTGPAHGRVGDLYLGTDAGRTARSQDWRASPVRADLAGVAPAILGVGAHDFLYQENIRFARALEAAGVTCTLRQFPTLNHGFFSFVAISPACAAAADSLCDDLREALRRAAA